ncbi:alpha-2,3-sialyltransferase, partial [Campylobacter coli]|nr:alpha-2,3-sialyltransferase [Campylobacter coli]
MKFFSICPTSPINNYIPLGKEQNNQEFIILKKTKYSYLKKILPSKKAKLRYKRIYLTSNSFIDFFY